MVMSVGDVGVVDVDVDDVVGEGRDQLKVSHPDLKRRQEIG